MTATGQPRYRRAVRPAEHRMIGGVAAGLADHLGVNVLLVRLGFVIGVWLNFAGVVAYLLLWRFMPLAGPEESPGAETAGRRGMREHRLIGDREIAQTLALCALGLGVGLLLQASGRGLPPTLVVPVVLAAIGLALVWRQFDDSAWDRWMVARTGWRSAARSVAGLALIAFATFSFVSAERGWSAVVDLAAALVVALLGLALVIGPWVSRLLSELAAERRERVRSQERADVAAHLHDSVLQTLALLQRNASDPATVATLARRQERELRDWLYGDQRHAGTSVAAALNAAAAEVETDHRVPVEVVQVGDAPVDDTTSALVQAAREAMVNAAKHSGAARVDVYLEAQGRELSVYVRDRGRGFDPEAVGADRLGISGSIIGRMERHGGRAVVVSAPGEGTEVRLGVRLDQTQEDS